VLKDMKQYRRMTDFLESSPQFMGTYVNLLNEAALRYFTAHAFPSGKWNTTFSRWFVNAARSPASRGIC
jgi:hypothetical protein